MKLLFIIFSVIVLVCAANAARLSAGATGLAIAYRDDGTYQILVDADPWFVSSPPGFQSNGVWYDGASGNLKLISSEQVKGFDRWGSWAGNKWTWNGGGIEYITSFAVSQSGIILFNQTFPKGVPKSNLPTNKDVSTAFPALKLANITPLRSFWYYGWPFTPRIYEGLQNFPSDPQGGVPATFYDETGRTVVFSPLNNFMTAMQSSPARFPGTLVFGLNGLVQEIPANFTHQTIIYSGHGMNQTLYEWGSILLDYYEKYDLREYDNTVQKLGYWTDNGAYYYYHTEPSKTYAQTMIDVYHYSQFVNITFAYFQFDSWWYPKGINTGVTLWEPMTSVFPNGMLDVDRKMDKIPLALHNRYFAPDSPYIKNFTFVVEKEIALPLDINLFRHIMSKAQGWGMVLYEQDWLVTTYMNMNATQNNVSNARNWLLAMGNAARELGLFIQYCMPLTRHLLQSVEINAVTQTRVSNDYKYAANNWQIGYPSLLAWSLGLAPFKDDFWSTVNQTECPYSDCEEKNNVLETLISALSAGPIGPADSIGNLNKDLIMRTCTDAAFLLKPDKPATPLDSAFLRSPVGSNLIDVWHTFSQYLGLRWNYLLAINLNMPYVVTAADLGIDPMTTPASVVIEYFDWMKTPTAAPKMLDASHSLTIAAMTPPVGAETVLPFKYYIIAPVLKSKYAVYGETSKFVTLSCTRFYELTDATTHFSFTVFGTPGEAFFLSGYDVLNNAYFHYNTVFEDQFLTIISQSRETLRDPKVPEFIVKHHREI